MKNYELVKQAITSIGHCTIKGLSESLSLSYTTIHKYLTRLWEEGYLTLETGEKGIYTYSVAEVVSEEQEEEEEEAEPLIHPALRPHYKKGKMLNRLIDTMSYGNFTRFVKDHFNYSYTTAFQLRMVHKTFEQASRLLRPKDRQLINLRLLPDTLNGAYKFSTIWHSLLYPEQKRRWFIFYMRYANRQRSPLTDKQINLLRQQYAK